MACKPLRAALPAAFVPLLAACGQAIAPSQAAHEVPIVVFGSAASAALLEAPCVIRPKVQVQIKSEVSGRVEEVLVAPGDAVTQGQLLARIDTRELDIQLERNRLAQRQTQTRIELAELQLERARRNSEIMARLNAKATASGATPPGVLGAEELEVREKQASLNQLRLDVDDLRLHERELLRSLHKTGIRAPMDGVVLVHGVEPGMLAGSGISQFGGGDVLFELGDVTRLRAECYAREGESWSLAVGLPAQLVADGRRDEPVALTLSYVAPVIELVSGVPRLKFEAEFTPASPRWRPGISAQIAVTPEASDTVPVLPASAVVEDAGGRYVYVQRGRSFHRASVSAVRSGDGWRIESGLKHGELVARDALAIDARHLAEADHG